MTDQQHSEAIDALAPETRSITGAGKTYEVKRLETRQIWPILRAGLPLLEGLTGLVAQASSPGDAQGTSRGAPQPLVPPTGLDALMGKEGATFLRTMAEHGERINEIVACALDCKVVEVGRFEPQETYLAIRAIIATNADFFRTRVAPMLGLEPGMEKSELASAVGKALGINGDGPTPSSS